MNSTVKSLAPSIIALTETWLDPNSSSSILGLSDYLIFRKDRISKGGGVLIGVKSTISCREINIICKSEIIAVDVFTSNPNHIRIIVCYNPNGNDITRLKELLTDLENVIGFIDNYVIIGDFNIDVKKEADIHRTKIQLINNFLSFHNLTQIVNFSTRVNRQIDYIIVNKNMIDTQVNELPPIGKSDHIAIFVTLNCTIVPKFQPLESFLNFRRANYLAIIHLLKHNILPLINQKIPLFSLFELFLLSSKNWVPKLKIKEFKSQKIFGHSLKIYNKLKKHYKKYKRDRNLESLKIYKALKKQYRLTLKTEQINFEAKLLKDKSRKNLYRYLKSRKTTFISINNLCGDNSELITDPYEICNKFNSYFCSVYKPQSYVINSHFLPCHGERVVISQTLLQRAFLHLKHSRGVGIDGIPIIFYQILEKELSPFIVKLFTEMANSCSIPEIWRTFVITPLFKKKGSRSDVSNYRPIAVSCAIYKLFETCIYLLIKEKLHIQISKFQYGFIGFSSTYSNLIDTYYKVFSSIDKRRSLDLITIDFSKAFDKVEVPLLIEKLKNFGMSPGICNLIFNLLTQRFHIVKCNAVLSKKLLVQNGLPQGSILSPLLFSVYLNDLLTKPLNSTVLAFADDLKLLGEPGQFLQGDLIEVASWSAKNYLPINDSKCECMHFGSKNPTLNYFINGAVIPNVNILRDLGLLVDSNLKFRSHRECVVSRALRASGFIFKCVRSRNMQLMVTLFKVYVVPILTYCSGIYANPSAPSFKMIEKVQKIFTRRLYAKLYPNTNIPVYNTRLQTFGLSSLSELFTQNHLMTLNRIILSKMKSLYFKPSFSSRKRNLICVTSINSSLYRNSFFHNALILWNDRHSSKPSSRLM